MFETLYPICSELCVLQISFINLPHAEKSLTMNSPMPEEMNLLPEKCVIFSSLILMSRVGNVGFSVGKFCISLKPECVICWKLPPTVLEKQHLLDCHLLSHRMWYSLLLAGFSWGTISRSIFWTSVPAAVLVPVVRYSVCWWPIVVFSPHLFGYPWDMLRGMCCVLRAVTRPVQLCHHILGWLQCGHVCQYVWVITW